MLLVEPHSASLLRERIHPLLVLTRLVVAVVTNEATSCTRQASDLQRVENWFYVQQSTWPDWLSALDVGLFPEVCL